MNKMNVKVQYTRIKDMYEYVVYSGAECYESASYFDTAAAAKKFANSEAIRLDVPGYTYNRCIMHLDRPYTKTYHWIQRNA